MKNVKLIAVSPTVLFGALVLSSCGGDMQDLGSTSGSQTTFTGVAIDGALARATVYLDSNNNATRDPWEDYAFTDNDGYYSYNSKTQTNYCDETAVEAEKIYCLRSARSFTDVVVRVDGGYDLLTGEPFMGQMSRRVNIGATSDRVDSVISPLTTLVSDLESTEERINVLNALRIQESDLDVNYFNSDGVGTINSPLLNIALKVHKTVTILSDRLNDNYEALNDESGVMNDPSAEIYRNMAQELNTNSTRGLDYVLTSSASLARVLDNSESVLRSLYEFKELTLPEDMGTTDNLSGFARVIDVATSVPDVVDSLLPSLETLSLNEAVGNARALESLVIKTVNEGVEEDSSIGSAVEFFTGEENRVLLGTLIDALSSERADVNSLSANDFTGSDFDSSEEIESVALLPDDSQVFSSLAGKRFRVSDLDLGTANALKDIEIELYFDDESNGIDGTFTACAKYIEDALADGTLGDANTRGELVSGYWSMLGATESNRESYSLLLTLNFLGATYQAIMKTVGTTLIDDVEYHQVRFDHSGEYRIWHSREGIVEVGEVPTTTRGCEERLPSRVGL